MIPALGFFVPFAIRGKTAAIQIRHQKFIGCVPPDEDKKDAIPDTSAGGMSHQSYWQCSSFNRLSIAYLRLNILEADCSAREGNRAGVAVRAAALFPFAQSVVNIPCWHTPKLYGRRF
jgi:hypothetical protein